MKIKPITRISPRIPLLLTVLPVVLATLMTGCKSVPEGSPALKQQALSFTPPPGMAGVYAIRPYQLAGSAILFDISLDYLEFGSLATDSYLFGLVPPGMHVLRVPRAGGQGAQLTGPGGVGADFTAEAGRNYFLQLTVGWNAPKITRLSEAEGQKYVKKLKLSGDSRFENRNKTGPISVEQIAQAYRKGRNMSGEEAVTTVQKSIDDFHHWPSSGLNTRFAHALSDLSERYGLEHQVISADKDGVTMGHLKPVVESSTTNSTPNLTIITYYGHYEDIKSESYLYPTVTKIVVEKDIFSAGYSGSFYGLFNNDLPGRRNISSGAILFYHGESFLGYHPILDSNDMENLLTAYLVLCPGVK